MGDGSCDNCVEQEKGQNIFRKIRNDSETDHKIQQLIIKVPASFSVHLIVVCCSRYSSQEHVESTLDFPQVEYRTVLLLWRTLHTDLHMNESHLTVYLRLFSLERGYFLKGIFFALLLLISLISMFSFCSFLKMDSIILMRCSISIQSLTSLCLLNIHTQFKISRPILHYADYLH